MVLLLRDMKNKLRLRQGFKADQSTHYVYSLLEKKVKLCWRVKINIRVSCLLKTTQPVVICQVVKS